MTLAQKHPKDSYILEQQIGIVYKITNKIQFDPFHEKYKYLNAWDSCYIGCTSQDLNERYQDGIENTHNHFLKKAIELYGKENFDIEVLEEKIRFVDLLRRERYYIQLNNCIYPNGYNIREGSESDNSSHRRKKESHIRNIKTNNVFSIKNLKHFCKNPSLYDKSIDENLKINYTQMSNALTGYVEPKHKKKGYDLPHQIIVSETYCSAKHTNKDLENFKQYLYKKSIEEFADKLIFPIELINFKNFNIIKIKDELAFAHFIINNPEISLSKLKRIFSTDKSGYKRSKYSNHDLILKENFKKNNQWHKYDINGEPAKFTLIHKKSGDTETFTWQELEALAQKLYLKSYASIGLKNHISHIKDVAHSTFGRSIRKLLTGELKICYGYKLDESNLPFKLRIKRFTTNKYVKKVLDLGYAVRFKNLPTDSKEEVKMTKKILDLLDIPFFL